MLAAREGDNKLLQSAIKEGANVSMYWRDGKICLRPIHAVAFRGFESCLKTLIQALADVNALDECKNTPLHMAALRGHINCVRTLTRVDQCLLNQWNITKKTPIHGAALNGHVECVEVLLS